jgi:hypothetical protein
MLKKLKKWMIKKTLEWEERKAAIEQRLGPPQQ